MKTVIGLAPGANVSGLAVIIAPNGPEAVAYPGTYSERVRDVVELPTPLSLAQTLLKIGEEIQSFGPPVILVCDYQRAFADPDHGERWLVNFADLDMLKVQGFLEGFGKALELPVVKVPYPERDGLWNAAWWQITRHNDPQHGNADGSQPVVNPRMPHHLQIDALAAAQRWLRTVDRATVRMLDAALITREPPANPE